MSVFFGDYFFDGCGHENVALFVHQILAGVRLSAGESDDGTAGDVVIFQLLAKEVFEN